MREAVISGVGITSALGRGKAEFARSLFDARNVFGVMERKGRQRGPTVFIGAEIREPLAGGTLNAMARGASFAGRVALATLEEAWRDAQLDDLPPERIGLIVGGSNLTQRDAINAAAEYADRPSFVRPSYAVAIWDTDLCGLCTAFFGIRGFVYSLGGASASGQLAVMQAADAVRSGKVDACVALGALTDLSYLECQALRNLGAMGTDLYADDPDRACRPFDRSRDGFIYGEACGAVVVEAAASAAARGIRPSASIRGYATVVAGNRQPQPDEACEIAVIRAALADARLSPGDVDYINPHGSGSILGDATELGAIAACGLSHARINATKSATGHGLSAAGAVEVIATVLQMERGELHPTRNLDDPEVACLNWIGAEPVRYDIRHALCLSYGFSGINTALCLTRHDSPEGLA